MKFVHCVVFHTCQVEFALPYGDSLPIPQPLLRVVAPIGWEFPEGCEILGTAILRATHGSWTGWEAGETVYQRA